MPYTCIRLQITTTVLLTCRPANLYRTCGRIVRDVGFAYQFTATYKLPYSWPVVEPKTATPQPCHHILTRAGEHAVYQSFLAPSSSSLSDPGRLQPSRSLKVSLLSRPSSSSDSHLEPRLLLSSFYSAEFPERTSIQ